MASNKELLKKILGELPLTAEVYQLLQQSDRPLPNHFSLRNIRKVLPEAVAAVQKSCAQYPAGKNVFIFASTHYWLEHGVITGLALSGLGHDVTIGYYPYGRWDFNSPQFDVRRQSVYSATVLRPASAVMNFENLLHTHSSFSLLPEALQQAVDQVTDFDYMYAFQTEEVNREDPFYLFRHERNLHAAKSLLTYLRSLKPEVAIIPNGTILEFGIAYKVCGYLKIPTTTYEFSDKRHSMWLAHNQEIMQQNTDELWKTHANYQLTNADLEELKVLLSSRKNASTYGDFSRQWQRVPAEGQAAIQAKLGFDGKPIVLLATNVLGDSLTLGRNTFSRSMSEWIIRTIQYFIEKPEVQLVIRIHPGEALIKHGSILDLIRKTLPTLPPHIHLIEPLAEVNTYDLMDIADLGLVYTTTVGLEMAMRGIPVIVAGKTHYRNRGFTHDPNTWVDYFKLLNRLLTCLRECRLQEDQVNLAWKYAYLFFFKYPLSFPWHMTRLKEDLEEYPLEYVLSEPGLEKFRSTLQLLLSTR